MRPEAPAQPGLPSKVLTKKRSHWRETIFASATSNGMTSFRMIAMPKIVDPIEPFDDRTSRLICDAVCERLRSLQPNSLSPTPALQHLLEELRRQEEASDASKRSQ